MARAPNHWLAKIHRAYRVDEVARLFCVHPNTVRRWLKAGLRTVDSGRPTVIHGPEAHGPDCNSETTRAR